MSAVDLWCCVTKEREVKTTRIMSSLAHGWGDKAQIVRGAPPQDQSAFAVWGHLWLAESIIPPAIKDNRPFWFIDNGYWKAARDDPENGHYRLTYRGRAPVALNKPDYERGAASGVKIKPWRKSGRHVVIATQSNQFGRPFGIDAPAWAASIEQRVRQHTDRPVVVRPKGSLRPLSADLRDCWALVTHSSNAAVEAVALGIPVFVEPDSAAAQVGNRDLSDMENPLMPDGREQWWNSLMCQQFSLGEMHDGTAYRHLSRVREQVDG